MAGAAPPERLLDAGFLNFNQLAALLRGAALYIGPDTSVSHLAAACGVPVLAIFGPTNPMRWAPWPAGTQPVRFARSRPGAGARPVSRCCKAELPCVPCGKAGCEDHRQSRTDLPAGDHAGAGPGPGPAPRPVMPLGGQIAGSTTELRPGSASFLPFSRGHAQAIHAGSVQRLSYRNLDSRSRVVRHPSGSAVAFLLYFVVRGVDQRSGGGDLPFRPFPACVGACDFFAQVSRRPSCGWSPPSPRHSWRFRGAAVSVGVRSQVLRRSASRLCYRAVILLYLISRPVNFVASRSRFSGRRALCAAVVFS